MYRTVPLDADNRPRPKTECFCVRCNKDLKKGQPHRMVHVVGGGAEVLHPADEAAFALDEEAQHGDLYFYPVGMDCAKKIGLEFTTEARS